MEAELVGYSIDGCYKYHHNKHLKLGMFIRGKETGDLKVVSFVEKCENEPVGGARAVGPGLQGVHRHDAVAAGGPDDCACCTAVAHSSNGLE